MRQLCWVWYAHEWPFNDSMLPGAPMIALHEHEVSHLPQPPAQHRMRELKGAALLGRLPRPLHHNLVQLLRSRLPVATVGGQATVMRGMVGAMGGPMEGMGW